MHCYVCRRRGTAQGITYTKVKKTPIVTFKCAHRECRFQYIAWKADPSEKDVIKTGSPRWRTPLRCVS